MGDNAYTTGGKHAFSPQGQSGPVNMPGRTGMGKPAVQRSESTEREQIRRSNAKMGTSEPASLLRHLISPNDAALTDLIFKNNRTRIQATGDE